jgi:hypothetical protein
VAVGARIILGPQRCAQPVIAHESPGARITIEGPRRVHDASEDPFAGNLGVLRKRKVVVFDGGILAPGVLEAVERT